MIRLNLLPPQEKKRLELTKFNSLLAFLTVWFSVFLIIFVLLLLSAFFSLSILLQEQRKLIEIRQSDPKTQYLLEIEEKIKQTNQIIKQVQLKQSEIILWTPLLEEISEIVPSGIYLNNFSFRTAKNQISLNGWANYRENLLGFQKSLEESSFFEEIEAPLANLIKQKDIDFNFTFKPLLRP